jgi:hypothetical protein
VTSLTISAGSGTLFGVAGNALHGRASCLDCLNRKKNQGKEVVMTSQLLLWAVLLVSFPTALLIEMAMTPKGERRR